ncbi:PKD domain-containing protein [Schlegelella sp. S2-27]|uniref:PKD domain-containing protein n=1 Tax=Caldimonas mangrovi TaxID=2944811 RepID=A0ABT0YQU8_9BURK|nr:M14 family zinc carboxypeptidase [Caldimonas mangrovi]MCM5681115.1 PKD domain-containing protein [Caldimonas mangrovi]
MKTTSLNARCKAAAVAAACALAAAFAVAAPNHPEAATQLRAKERQRTHIYKAHFPDPATARKAAISLHANLLEADYDQGYLVFELQADEIATLQRFGFRIERADDFIARRDRLLSDIEAANAARASKSAAGAASTDAGIQAIPGYACYRTVEENHADAEAMVAEHPQLADWFSIGESWQRQQGQGGYELRVLKLTNKAIGGDKPKLLINSAIHAREYATTPLVLDFARWLLDGHGQDADATWILDHHEVHLLLHTNPDGRKRAEAGILWRKNVNMNYCPHGDWPGADLNRNFTFDWNVTDGVGSSGDQCSQVYRGPRAGSEPEVQALERYIRNLWPDRRGPGRTDPAPADTSGIHLDIHSYSQLVLWPWGTGTEPAPNGNALQTLGRRFAFFNKYTPTQSIGLYPTDGTSDGPSYGELGVAAYTFELGTSFFQDCQTYEHTIKPDNLPALVYAAKVSRAPYQMPGGPDVTSLIVFDDDGAPVGTPVWIEGIATDERYNNSNGTEPTQAIAAVEAYIGTPPWIPGAAAVPLEPIDGAYDAKSERFDGVLPTKGLKPGRHIVYVRSRDASGQFGPVSAVFVDVTDPPPPVPLHAAFKAECQGLACSFDGSLSSGNITAYAWDFGDGMHATGRNASHTYRSGGTYQVMLSVTDGSVSRTATQSVTVTAPPTIELTASVRSYWLAGRVQLRWSGATGDRVDIYRNGVRATSARNDGSYTEWRSPGTWRYKVCQAGSAAVCSAEQTVSF